MSDLPALCNQCGTELREPDKEVAHPDDDNPPDDAHFKVQIRDHDGGERLQCVETGHLAKPVNPSDDDYREVYEEKHDGELPIEEAASVAASDSEQISERGPTGNQSPDDVFEFEEEKSQIDILAEVVANPHYGLEDPQITEVISWAEDFNGQMPPDVLQDLVSNMKGVQKQTAELIKRRYEIKLNNWFRKQQNQDNDGPPIGVMGGPRPNQRGMSSPNPRPTPTPKPEQPAQEPNVEGEEPDEFDEHDDSGRRVGGLPNQDIRKERRQRRVKRRNDALDITAEEMANEAAPQIARELSKNFGTYFGLPAKILEAKAERDPDWFLEKADEIEEKLGITLFDILEESETKKQEREQAEQERPPDQTEVDNEMDAALEKVRNDSQSQNEQDNKQQQKQSVEEESTDQSQTETVNTENTVPDSATPMKSDEPPELEADGNGEEETTDADEMYNNIFGGDE